MSCTRSDLFAVPACAASYTLAMSGGAVGPAGGPSNAFMVEHKPGDLFVNADGQFQDGDRVYNMESMLLSLLKEAGKVAKQKLAFSVQELRDANRDSKQAIEFLNVLRSVRPDGKSTDKMNTGQRQKLEYAFDVFRAKNGIYPYTKFGVGDPREGSLQHGTGDGAKYSQAEIDQMIEGTKSYLSTINSNQQMIQLDTQRYTHTVDETSESMSSIEKAFTQAVETIISKI